MRFRYIFEKDWKRKVFTPSIESLQMKAYDYMIEKGYKVVKREIEIDGKFIEIL